MSLLFTSFWDISRLKTLNRWINILFQWITDHKTWKEKSLFNSSVTSIIFRNSSTLSLNCYFWLLQFFSTYSICCLTHRKKHVYIIYIPRYDLFGASQVSLVINNLPANAGDVRDAGSIPGSGRSSGGGHGNLLQCFCWRIPWTEERGGLQSMGSQRVGHDWHDPAQHREHVIYLIIVCYYHNSYLASSWLF